MSPVGEYLLHSAVTLLGVGLLAALLIWSSRRWGGSSAPGNLELVSRLPLEARRAVYVVRVGGRLFVLGATDHALTKIAELQPSELPSSGPLRPTSFADFLRRGARPIDPTTTLNDAQPTQDPQPQAERAAPADKEQS